MISVRRAKPDDAAEMCDLLNEIIKQGGTTAHEDLFSEAQFIRHFITDEKVISCFVALDASNKIAGFQNMTHHQNLPEKWADIATFARQTAKVKGVGTALFEQSKSFARQNGFIAINATIRADNKGGLAFYNKMGFETYAETKGKPLKDGTPIDRISKQYFIS